MSKISYFIVRTFDVKHHAAHGTILINFGSEKGFYMKGEMDITQTEWKITGEK
jgi:hypothetical protein